MLKDAKGESLTLPLWPRLPLIRLAPKHGSSTSIPPSKRDYCSQNSAILSRRRNKYGLTVLRFKFVKIAIFSEAKLGKLYDFSARI